MYEKQMELFEDGGEVDPVSGNNIPLGSTAEEVRDDQPAMLSEGEMVVPADVVRYFGVEFFMDLRDKAKIGYKKMEAMGQFGTEEGQTLPDDTLFNAGGPPFTIEDIEVIEDYEEKEEEPTEKKSIKAADGALIDDNAVVTDDDLTNTGNKVAFNFQDVQDLIGTNSFEYLKKLMPASLAEQASEEEQIAIENYGANIATNLNTALGNVSGNAGAGSGGGENAGDPLSRTGSGNAPTPGTGDINTLMSYPTTANIAGLQSLGNLLNSDLGKSALAGFGLLSSIAMNPGQVAPVVGLAQRAVGMLEKGLMGTSKISDGFAALRDIPTIQANMANRAARSFSYGMKDMAKEDKDAIDAVFSMQQYADSQGYGNIANNPSATIGITSRGEVVGKFSQGPLAATYNSRGEIIGDKVVQTFTPEQVKNAYEKGISLVEAARNAADPNFSPSKTDPGRTMFGGWGGPLSDDDAKGFNSALSPAVDYSIEGSFDPSYNEDPGSIPGGNVNTGRGFGSVAEGEGEAAASGGGGDVDPGGMTGAGAAGAGGGAGDTSDTGGSSTGAADTGADSSTSDDGSASPGDFKHGGFVHKRKSKKKKKRRGLAGR